MSNYLLAREMAESSVVMLENKERLLPLEKGKKLAVFGRTQRETIFSGNGSGAVSVEGAISILEAFEKEGFQPVEELSAYYRRQLKLEGESQEGPDWSNLAAMSKLVHSGAIYEYFGQYQPVKKEPEIPGEILEAASKQTDTAVYILGRCAGGEECDRHLEDDYYLSREEKLLIEKICGAFSRVVLVLNINGLIDLSWTDRYQAIQSILFLGIPGEAGAEALVRILSGRVSPSGKLAVTIPQKYEDIPCAEHFSWNKNDLSQIKTYADYGLSPKENGSTGFALSPVTVYQEGIYNGYRYFDSFQVKPRYFFGYGLSYTEFTLGETKIRRIKGGLELCVPVTNEGAYAGREVVQVYVNAGRVRGDIPSHWLLGFAKTGTLLPGEEEILRIRISWRSLAHYEEKEAAWIISKGDYGICLGGDMHHLIEKTVVCVPENILVEQCKSLLGLSLANRGKIDFLKRDGDKHNENREKERNLERLVLRQKDISREMADAFKEGAKLSAAMGETIDFKLKGLSIEELASLCVGYGPGTPFSAFEDKKLPSAIYGEDNRPLTVNDHPAGLPGYVSPAMPDRDIHSVSYGDGPAGIGMTAWPSEMLLACSFDEKLCERFGDAAGRECQAKGVDIWLAPAVNLHRNPLCGRAFEYFSEDPLLTGTLALAVTRGVQKNHSILVCPKHFALNEQETFRRGSTRLNVDAADSIAEERTLRELYLRPFEMLVREGHIHCLMTSFNKINGKFAAGNRELCTLLLRDEWGFCGAVVTDWGDMDVVVDGGDAVAAGNDIVMPGGPPVIRQILQSVKRGSLSRGQLALAAKHYLYMISCV